MTNEYGEGGGGGGPGQPEVPPARLVVGEPLLGGPPAADPTLVQPTVASSGSGAVPPGEVPPPGGGGGGQPPAGGSPDEPGRPAWLVPLAGGLVVGLLVALVAVVVLRDDNDGGTTESAPVTTVAGELPVTPEITVAPAPETTVVAVPDATAAAPPETTLAPAPETTLPADAGIPVASPGFARDNLGEYPILRTCLTVPLAPNGADYQVNSYLYRDGEDFLDIVERWFDEGGATAANAFGEIGLPIEDLGEGAFGVSSPSVADAFVSVNPLGGPDECPGTVVTSAPGDTEFPYTYSIVDVCTIAASTGFYDGSLSERSGFVARANDGDGTYSLDFVGVDGEVNDPAATVSDLGGGGVEIRGTGALDVVITITDSQLGECRN